jgi:hypothetical protein
VGWVVFIAWPTPHSSFDQGGAMDRGNVVNRRDFTYVKRHRFLPYSLLNHTARPTQWFGTRYETEEEATAEAKKAVEFSGVEGIQVEVIKEEVIWKFSNDGFVGKWGRSAIPEVIDAKEEREKPQELTQEELIWRLFTEKLKTRKEIAVIVGMSYDNVCKIIRAEKVKKHGPLGINADAR